MYSEHLFFFFNQKTAYEMRISDWSSDVCSSDLNYVQIARLPKRLQRMVAQTRSLTIVTTNTEAEALLLEAQLIKRFRPAYNVLLRDDKSFPFILLRDDHAFPRVMKHSGARRHKGRDRKRTRLTSSH